jgi:hypothetical protein
MYKALGADVPDHKVFQGPDGPTKVARFVDGQTLKQAMANDPVTAAAAMETLRGGFVKDSLLGNWDVVGMEYDNVLIGHDQKVYRIDNGGSLRYRAQGGLKKGWDQYPDEVFTLRDAGKNSQTHHVFGKLTFGEVAKQAQEMTTQGNWDKFKAATPSDLTGIMTNRWRRMSQLSTIYSTLSSAGHSDVKIEAYTKRLWGNLRAGKWTDPGENPAAILASFQKAGG